MTNTENRTDQDTFDDFADDDDELERPEGVIEAGMMDGSEDPLADE